MSRVCELVAAEPGHRVSKDSIIKYPHPHHSSELSIPILLKRNIILESTSWLVFVAEIQAVHVETPCTLSLVRIRGFGVAVRALALAVSVPDDG
jgi:hypothetical protein